MPRLDSKLYKIDVHVYRVQAKCNKSTTRARVTAVIDGQRLEFKDNPQIKRNIANFSCNSTFNGVKLAFDPKDGLYEDRNMTVVVEFVNMGTATKVGQASVNLGNLLNSKKFLVPTVYPLAQCYDKSATIKLSVGFQSMSQVKKSIQFGQMTEEKLRHQTDNNEPALKKSSLKDIKNLRTQLNQSSLIQRSHVYLSKVVDKQSTQKDVMYDIREAKQRFRVERAQDQNKILQNKIQELQSIVEQMRQEHATTLQRHNEDSWRKDQRALQLQTEIKKLSDQISDKQRHYDYLNSSNKRLFDTHQMVVGQKNSASVNLEKIQNQNESLKKQVSNLRSAVATMEKKIQSKDKHYKIQQDKYSERFMESEHQKNMAILEMEARIKEQKERGERNLRQITKQHQSKFLEANHVFRDKTTKLQEQNYELALNLQEEKNKSKAHKEQNEELKITLQNMENQSKNISQKLAALQIKYQNVSGQLDLVPITVAEKDGEIKRLREDVKERKRIIDQQNYQIRLANETISEEGKKVSKFKNEILLLKQREHFMKQKFQEQVGSKQIDIKQLIEDNNSWQLEVVKLTSKLKIVDDKLIDQTERVRSRDDLIRTLQSQIQKSKQKILFMEEQNLSNKNEALRCHEYMAEKDQLIEKLRQENQSLERYMAYKNQNMIQAQEEQGVDFNHKINLLQQQIKVLILKNREERHQLEEMHERQISKLKEQIDSVLTKLRKQQEEFQEFKLKNTHIFIEHAEFTKVVEDLKEKVFLKTQDYQKLQIAQQDSRKLSQTLSQKLEAYQLSNVNLQKEKQQKQIKLSHLRSKQSTIKSSLTKFLISMMDKISNRTLSNTHIFTEIDTTIQEQIDTQVINYVNTAIQKNFQYKTQLGKKVDSLQEEKNALQIEVERLRLQINFFQGDYGRDRNSFKINSRLGGCNNIEHADMVLKNDQLKANLKRAERETVELRSRIGDLSDQRDKYRDLYDQTHSKQLKMKKQYEQLNQQLYSCQLNSRAYKQRVTTLEDSNKQIRDRVQDYQSKQTQWKKQKQQNIQQKLEGQSNIQKALLETENKMTSMKTTLEQLEKNLKEERDKNKSLNKKIAEVSDSLREKDIKLAALQQSKSELENQVEKLQGKVRLQTNVNLLQKEKVQTLDKVKQELHKVQKNKDALEQQVRTLKRQNQKLSQELKEKQIQFKKSLREKQEEIMDIESRSETKDLQIKSVNRSWEQITDEKDKKIKFLEKQIQKVKNEWVQLSLKCEELQKEIAKYRQQSEYQKQIDKKQERMRNEFQGEAHEKEMEYEETKFALQAKVMELQRQLKQQTKTHNSSVYTFKDLS